MNLSSGIRRAPADRIWSGVGRWAAILVACAMVVVWSGCSRTATPARDPSKLTVVCTTGMIADAARVIAGDLAVVTALMGEGVDPHLYKASPGDIRKMSEADLVLYNGLHLEGRMEDALVNLSRKRAVWSVTDGIDREHLRNDSESGDAHDPHVWFDVMLWKQAVTRVRDALIHVDPSHKDEYVRRADAYLVELDALHIWCREQISAIPESRRVLITAHDAFGYFGQAYGIEVRAIQGVSTDSEAGIRAVNDLVGFIIERKIPAVFVESSVPRKAIEALIEGCSDRGHVVRIGGELYSDALGPAGTDGGTYIGMVRHNVRTIVAAITGMTAEAPVRGPR